MNSKLTRFPDYLNEYHRKTSMELKAIISKRPKRSREEAYAQYDRLELESLRSFRKDLSAEGAKTE